MYFEEESVEKGTWVGFILFLMESKGVGKWKEGSWLFLLWLLIQEN